MKNNIYLFAALFFLTSVTHALGATALSKTYRNPPAQELRLIPGAEQLAVYLPLLAGKKVGILANQTSLIKEQHLVDVLLEKGVDVRFIFAPEHGFRGVIERGEPVKDGRDTQTGLPVHSFYGRNSKAGELVSSVDVMLFDLQDVGARFYTYITALHQLMELCAEKQVPLLVFDRPNPNGDQVDGPVRKEEAFKSDVSFHKIAMIHGLTVGELATMINGESWLAQGRTCSLTVVPVKNYTHSRLYTLPVAPSPSLPNEVSVRLYPSLCLFEGTDISVGRGTDWPFQVLGGPNPAYGDFTFTPGTKTGMALHVEQQGDLCYGLDLRGIEVAKTHFTLAYVLDFYHKSGLGEDFFSRPDFFDKLAGTDQLRKQILAGWSEQQIRDSWEEDLKAYRKMRKKYLLYPDF